MKRPNHPPHQWNYRGSIGSYVTKSQLGFSFSTDDAVLIKTGDTSPPKTLRGKWPWFYKGCITLFEHPGEKVAMRSKQIRVKRKLFGFIPLPDLTDHRILLPDGGGELEVNGPFADRTYSLNGEHMDVERQEYGAGRWSRFQDFDLYVPKWTSAGEESTFSFRERGHWPLAALCAYVEHVEYVAATAG